MSTAGQDVLQYTYEEFIRQYNFNIGSVYAFVNNNGIARSGTVIKNTGSYDAPIYFTLLDNVHIMYDDGLNLVEINLDPNALFYPEQNGNIIKTDKFIVKKIWDQPPKFCEKAVSEYGLALRHVKIQTNANIMRAIENNPDAIQYVEDRFFSEISHYTEKFMMRAVEKDPLVIRHLDWRKQRMHKICEYAVEKDPSAIIYCIHKTHILCMCAVSRNGLLIKDLPENILSPILCEAAVQNNYLAIEYVGNYACELLYRKAILNNPKAIEYIHPLEITDELRDLAEKEKTNPKYLHTK